MSKRGQVTVFIILGLIIVAALGLFYLRGIAPPEQDATLPTGPIQQYVESCISNTASQGIINNGRNGGYFVFPDNSTKHLFENVPYYYDVGDNIPPEKDIFANQIALYVDTMLDLCVNDFRAFPGYNITPDVPSSSATISDQTLTLTTVFPLIIRKGTSVKELTSFQTVIAVPQLVQDIAVAQQIIENQQQEEVCITCFSSLAAENNVFVGILPIGNSTYLIDLVDRDYVINNEEYHLRFAMRYNETLE